MHIIPRSEVRHVEVCHVGGDGWALKYQLTHTLIVRSIEWKGESRPASLKEKIDIGAYNRIAAGSLLTMLTSGHRDIRLERRANNIFLVRSGLIEEDERVALCRKFITEMALTARQTAIGPLDDTRRQMLNEIQDAARDLILPDWYPLKEELW